MPKEKRFEIKMDKTFYDVAKKDYADKHGISMAEAFRASMEDTLTLAGIDWKAAVEKSHCDK